jgi:hypothetical protein
MCSVQVVQHSIKLILWTHRALHVSGEVVFHIAPRVSKLIWLGCGSSISITVDQVRMKLLHGFHKNCRDDAKFYCLFLVPHLFQRFCPQP